MLWGKASQNTINCLMLHHHHHKRSPHNTGEEDEEDGKCYERGRDKKYAI
jgi:hypothetical protein